VKYLITGAAGFVGSNLSLRLKSSGHQVVGVDNFSPYYSPELKRLRVIELLSPHGIEVASLDLCHLDPFQEFVKSFQPSVIIHLAAQPGVRTPIGKSFKYIQNNIVAFSNVMQAAVENNVPEILYASSSSVYGNSTAIPYRESDESIQPISIYGATKLANEILASTFVRNSRTRARGMRFFTVYGPWGRPDMAYFRLIGSALNQTEFKKFGDGEVKRDFTYVDDISAAIEKLSLELESRPEGYADVVNIGGGNPHSLNDLINVICSQMRSTAPMLESETNPNDTSYTCADVSRLWELTQTSPKIDLESGIRSTIAWAQRTAIRDSLSSWINSTN
jgi:UDP-glucuronate 4-epimerase